MRVLMPTAQIGMTIDPYYQRQKYRPIALVSGNIRCMWIFAGGSSQRGRQITVGLSTTAIFGDLGATSSETSGIRPAILYDDMLPLVGL